LCKMSIFCGVFCVFFSNSGSAVSKFNRHLKMYRIFPLSLVTWRRSPVYLLITFTYILFLFNISDLVPC
jgi:hypothetical protein